MSSVQFVQGGTGYGNYSSGHSGQVLPGDTTPGDAVVLMGTLASTVTSAIGSFVKSPQTDGLWVCADVTGSADAVTVTGGGWYASALEFGPNAGIGYASAGYANLSGGNNTLSGIGSFASATVENVTPGAALIVFAYATSEGNFIVGDPGSPWTGLSDLVNIEGLGAAWLIASNADSIPISFETSSTSWEMILVEILPLQGPTVTSVSLSAGVSGTSVTVTGTNLSTATAVDFGSTSAGFTVVSAEEITATAPPGTGTVDVTVTSPNGTSPTSSVDQFTYTYAGPYSLSVALSQAQAMVTLS